MAKPVYKRAERVADQIRMEVADILARKSKDPRLNLVTVTDADISPDLRNARVYVTTLQEGESMADVMEGLEHAVGFIRSELGRRLELRYTPQLTFQADTSGRTAQRIWKILDELPADSSTAQAKEDGGMDIGSEPSE